jgi:hypothetical protein
MNESDVRQVVADVLAEQHRKNATDEVVLKTVAAILTSFGMDDDERLEVKADFQFVRRFRKSSEQVQGFAWKAAVTVVITGILGALWLGFKVLVGK